MFPRVRIRVNSVFLNLLTVSPVLISLQILFYDLTGLGKNDLFAGVTFDFIKCIGPLTSIKRIPFCR